MIIYNFYADDYKKTGRFSERQEFETHRDADIAASSYLKLWDCQYVKYYEVGDAPQDYKYLYDMTRGATKRIKVI